MDHLEIIKGILLESGENRHTDVVISKLMDGFEIDYSRMYSAPGLSFEKLKKLSEYFGTEKIDVDDYGQSGCETCDWGSEYGHRIQVYKPTKNIPSF